MVRRITETMEKKDAACPTASNQKARVRSACLAVMPPPSSSPARCDPAPRSMPSSGCGCDGGRERTLLAQKALMTK